MSPTVFSYTQHSKFEREHIKQYCGEELIIGQYYAIGFSNIGQFLGKSEKRVESYENVWSNVYQFKLITNPHLNKPIFERICRPDFPCFFSVHLDSLKAEIEFHEKRMLEWKKLYDDVKFTQEILSMPS